MFAKLISREERLSEKECDLAFTAGLLHDLGHLVLAEYLPGLFQKAAKLAEDRKRPVWQVFVSKVNLKTRTVRNPRFLQIGPFQSAASVPQIVKIPGFGW